MATNMNKKTKRVEENREKRPYAVAKYVRVSPYKVRTVLALIRGKSYQEAKAILDYSTNGSALAVKKVLMSAAANAEHNKGMDRADLVVAECFADGGQMLKRMQPVSKGRGHAILKRTSHITVILDVKRVGIINGWSTQWYADKKEFSKYLKEDNVIRTFIKKKYYAAAISKILIERAASRIVVTIFTARPGVIIGKAGAEVENIKKDLAKLTGGKAISINITEVRKPDCDAQLVAEGVAAQLEKRMSFRRSMKQAIGRSMRAGVKGIKMMVSGRLDGAEIARCEQYHEGSIPLQTLRADIDYGFAEAHTTFGMIGVKCWIYKGEVLKSVKKPAIAEGGEQ